jgi:WD40 repeat protein
MLSPLHLAITVLAQAPATQLPIEPIVTLSAHQPQAIAVAFSPDGKSMATSGANRFVTVREPATGEIRQVFTGHPGLVHEVAFSPGSTLLASAGAEGIVILWSLESGKKILSMQALSEDEGTARSVAFSPVGHLLATGASDGTIKIWDLKEQKARRQLSKETLPVTAVKFSPDGTTLATSTGNWRRRDLPGALRLWEVATGKELAQLEGHECEIKRIDYSSTGKRLVSAGADRTILVWDTERRVIVNRFRVNAVPGSLAMCPSGQWLAVGDLRGGVTVWNVERGMRIREYAGHEAAVLGIAVHPEGKLLATASHDGTIKLWPADFH